MMEIVIKIPDKIYKFVQNTSFVENESTLFKQTSTERQKTLFLFDILDAIKNGTPLSEYKFLQENYETLDMGIKALEQTKWIPCSEKLPKISKGVLITNGTGMYIGWFDSFNHKWRVYNNDYNDDYLIEHIKAWIPLPEPYEGE